MRIFGKRKKKDPSAAKAATPVARTSFASDPVVEELLKKDPSEWNAKQKRMVKRYQQRRAQCGEQKQQEEAPVAIEIDPEEKVVESSRKDNEVARENGNSSSEKDNDSDSSSSGESDKDEKVRKEEQATAETTDKNEPATQGSKAEVQQAPSATAEAEDSGKVDKSHPVYKLLDQLNSKNKRTLARKLARGGAKVLQEVEGETKILLGITPDNQDSKKRGADAMGSGGGGKCKKRKKKVDWSTLPADERLRREEQRRLQKEAARRRSNAETGVGIHKHPLNSERRRANRRKPKWKNTFKVEEKKNHNASGFLARRDSGQRQKLAY